MDEPPANPILSHVDEPQPQALVWRWRLASSAPIPVEATVDVASALMAALNETAKALFGSNRLPPDLHLAGAPQRQEDGSEIHAHAFVLPEDLDVDGVLDHLCVALASRLGARGFTRRGLSILAACPGFWLGRIDAALQPAWLGPVCALGMDAPSATWCSLTPFAPPLLRGAADAQLASSLRRVRLPDPIGLERLAVAIAPGGREVRATAFRPEGPGRRRWDEKPAFEAHRREMAFWRVDFAEPVAGPIIVGGLTHYGLGRFAPASE